MRRSRRESHVEHIRDRQVLRVGRDGAILANFDSVYGAQKIRRLLSRTSKKRWKTKEYRTRHAAGMKAAREQISSWAIE